MNQLENAVALSAVFHQDRRYQGYYDDLPHNRNGFTGVWAHVAKAARIFCEVEAELGASVWDDRDWIRCIDHTVELLYANGYEHVSDADLKQQIKEIFDDE